MNLRAAFLADAAMQNADGTFMIWRGGVTETTAPMFPAPVHYALVLRLEADPEEAARLHEMTLGVYLNGNLLGPQQTTPLALRVAPEEPRIYLNVVVVVQFVALEPGEGYVEVVLDRELVVPRVYFSVRRTPGGQPTGRE